jgi:hypothetical protein
MSDTDTPDKGPPHATLYITDAELIRRLGVPEKIARQAIKEMDAKRDSGFPQKSRLWGDRRYWPAVKAWLDRTNGLKTDAPTEMRRAS